MLTLSVSLQQGNVKKSEKKMKIVNIEEENLRIFWMTWGISMKFSGKVSLMIILKIRKSRGSPCLSKRCIFGKAFLEGPPALPLAFLRLKISAVFSEIYLKPWFVPSPVCTRSERTFLLNIDMLNFVALLWECSVQLRIFRKLMM